MLELEFSPIEGACQYPRDRDEPVSARNVVTTLEREVVLAVSPLQSSNLGVGKLMPA